MFDGFDALLLARIQFAFTVSFHFIFPALSIGLASYLMVLEGLWLKTGKQLYLDLFKYWLKIFAITFAMGVVSGIVMSYQFGTNWAVFSDKGGNSGLLWYRMRDPASFRFRDFIADLSNARQPCSRNHIKDTGQIPDPMR